jgi:hypothetical protein
LFLEKERPLSACLELLDPEVTRVNRELRVQMVMLARMENPVILVHWELREKKACQVLLDPEAKKVLLDMRDNRV